MGIFDKFKPKKIEGVDQSEYLTLKEERRISAENKKIFREYEKNRRRTVDESVYLTSMRDPDNVVEFDDLHTYFYTDVGTVKAVNGVTFDIPKGKIVGVVGESGCGKSVTSLSLMQLVQAPHGQIVSGSIRYQAEDGKAYDISKMPMSEMLKIRGKDLAMIFQEPMTSLNPVFKIGDQMDEVVMLHVAGATDASAKARSIEMLNLVGIAMAENVYNSYPHELSGGMRQRVMIAMALSCDPRLIIADEPTTALDVTIQAQILELLRDVKDRINGSIMLITHDLGVIAEMADFVVVMYAGKIIEQGTVHEIFHEPKHPYTVGLMRSKPNVDNMVERLYSIPGQVPNPINMPSNCYFYNRCDKAMDICSKEYPGMIQFSETHFAACHLYTDDKDAVFFEALGANIEEEQE
ncbi:MAG: ABC transporter ATP-binding protein [Clostridia bacterium]|nr:ABC transporter ATP-binding protein [Eubacteriales bacterium]MDD3866188.1 ABC transporter ATP-binding protein [Eubacteriales bacterium]MDD4461272.1 ABC transporter ATP-binding protein [Eubacteriales bacterium]NCC48477.1 ABC transporter ATP-binding protein [Clostridia bacterium]